MRALILADLLTAALLQSVLKQKSANKAGLHLQTFIDVQILYFFNIKYFFQLVSISIIFSLLLCEVLLVDLFKFI